MALVVSAGSWDDPVSQSGHRQIAAERRLLSQACDAGIPTLGVCFGAQLLAANAGASLFRLAAPQHGWRDVEVVLEDVQRPRSFFWNSWGFEAPVGAEALCTGPDASWAFALGSAVAVQFHLDVTPALLERWLADAFSGQDRARRLDGWLNQEGPALRDVPGVAKRFVAYALSRAGHG